jgi:hypothetical protein
VLTEPETGAPSDDDPDVQPASKTTPAAVTIDVALSLEMRMKRPFYKKLLVVTIGTLATVQ